MQIPRRHGDSSSGCAIRRAARAAGPCDGAGGRGGTAAITRRSGFSSSVYWSYQQTYFQSRIVAYRQSYRSILRPAGRCRVGSRCGRGSYAHRQRQFDFQMKEAAGQQICLRCHKQIVRFRLPPLMVLPSEGSSIAIDSQTDAFELQGGRNEANHWQVHCATTCIRFELR